MARLFTSGAEIQYTSAGSAGSEGPGYTGSGTVAVNTSTPNSGAACFSLSASGAGFNIVQWTQNPFVLGSDYYMRGYFNLSALPTTNNFYLMAFDSAAGHVGGIQVSPAGQLQVNDAAVSGHVTNAFTIAANQWFEIEFHAKAGTTTSNGTIEGRFNGQSIWSAVGTANAGTVVFTFARWGKLSSTDPAIATCLIDDIAVNDQTGTAQTSWPNPGKVVLLKPLSDNSRTGWTAGAAGTTNLQNAVKTTPAAGLADASATITSQIRDTTANVTDAYAANLNAYSTTVTNGGGGIDPNDAITLVESVAIIAPATAAACQVGQKMTSNPVIAENVPAATAATAAATYPTGWTTQKGTVTYRPAVSLGGSPVMSIRKATSAVTEDVALMGLQVEYIPGSPQLNVNQAVSRSAVM